MQEPGAAALPKQPRRRPLSAPCPPRRPPRTAPSAPAGISRGGCAGKVPMAPKPRTVPQLIAALRTWLQQHRQHHESPRRTLLKALLSARGAGSKQGQVSEPETMTAGKLSSREAARASTWRTAEGAFADSLRSSALQHVWQGMSSRGAESDQLDGAASSRMLQPVSTPDTPPPGRRGTSVRARGVRVGCVARS